MFADQLRRSIQSAPRNSLPDVARALWGALAAGQISEAQAETLSAEIDARRVSPPAPPARRVGSRPVTDASLERRRRWAASGLIPPTIAASFTASETAALAVVALEVSRSGSCQWPHARIAAVAGVSVSTVKRAVREAKRLGLIDVQERRVSWWRNDSNIITITSPTWVTWLSRRGGGQPWPRTVSRGTRVGRETGENRLKGMRGGEGGDRRRQNEPPVARFGPGRPSRVSTGG